MQKQTALRILFTLFCLVIFIFFGSFLSRDNWLETDLGSLLPKEEKWLPVQLQADQIQEQKFNQQIIAIVGHSQPDIAYQTAERICQDWQQYSIFHQVDCKTQPDLTALSEEIQQLKIALLPNNIRSQLLQNPATYFLQYAEDIANPFNKQNLLTIDQDWIGLGRFTLSSTQKLSDLKWNMDNGMLYTLRDKKTWVVIRGVLAQNNIINAHNGLPNLIDKSKQIASEFETELLATGASLFAAHAKKQAEKESIWLSVIAITLTLLLLLFVFRSLQVFWLFLPIIIGMLTGITVTVFFFGQIHILTLVIGTSLIGVLIDFPLHWASSSLFSRTWNGYEVMKALCPTFMISLLVTLLGYSLLGMTSLPVLKQTALFSASALISSMAFTLLFLPVLYKGEKIYSLQWLDKIQITLTNPIRLLLNGLLVFITLFILSGMFKANWKDDIRQWIITPKDLLQDTLKIGDLTGINLSTHYFLLTAENDEKLLELDAKISQKLTALSQPHQSLSHWIMSEKQQQDFIKQMQARVKLGDFAILEEIGIPIENIQKAIDDLILQPSISLQTGLQSSLGQGWRTLYLGDIADGLKGAVVKISQLKNKELLKSIADNRYIFWQDKIDHLNQSFQQTRNQAAWLKVFSFVLAGLLLCKWIGWRKSGKILYIPLLSVFATIGIFGWLGMPISLFAMFGLLLVSAISIDYTAYMQTAKEEMIVKRTAISLAALTTIISFVLLSFSSTPAVSMFGLSVSIGVAFSLFVTLRFFR